MLFFIVSQMLLLLLPRLLLWSFLTQFLFKSDAKFTSGCLARPLLWSFLINFLFKFLPKCSWLPRLLLGSFLFHFLCKFDPKWTSGCIVPPLVAVSYSILLQTWFKMLLFLPRLLLLSFLTHSDSNLMQNALLAASSPPVVVSYQLLLKLYTTCLSGYLSSSRGCFLVRKYVRKKSENHRSLYNTD